MKIQQKHYDIFRPSFRDNLLPRVKANDPKALKLLVASVQAFLNAPAELAPVINNGTLEKVAVQAFTNSSDLPDPKVAFEVFSQMKNYDMRWQDAYRLRTFDQYQDSFAIVNVKNGFTFEQIEEGQRISVKRFTGSQLQVKAVTFGEAIGWHKNMLEDRRYGEFIDTLQEFIAAYSVREATEHYKILGDCANASGQTTTYQAGDNALDRVRNTIDAGMAKICDDLKDTGVFPDVGNIRFLLYVDRTMERKIRAALQDNPVSAVNTSVAPQGVEIRLTYLMQDSNGAKINGTNGVLVASGGQLQRGIKTPLEFENGSDPLSFQQLQVARARFGAGAGNIKQVRKLQFA